MAEVVFDHVTRIYPGNDKPSVDDLNLDIKDGEFLVLVGPSGCGKSTTLRMLAGLEEVNKGRILIGGNDVTTMQPKDRDIAMVFQNKLRVQTRTQIAALQRQLGVTTLYVTHDQTEALTMGDRIAVIKLGVLQQVGAPTELYDRPANVFVAGFIGSPSMNINTHPVVNGKAKIGEDTVDLPAEAVNKLTAEDGGKIVVGFRPEDATLATPDDPNAFSLKVQNIEDLGSDGYIYGTIITDGSAAEASTMMSDQNKLTTIRVNPRALPKIGQTVKIKIDPSKMHLFAPSTELRLN